jgi:hypothetical protein
MTSQLSPSFSPPVWRFLWLVLLFTGCTEPKSAKQICPAHQYVVWDAAAKYYLEQGMKPDDLVDPRHLSAFFPDGKVPRCPQGTNSYAPFRILDGPKCSYEPRLHESRRVPPSIAKLGGRAR